MSDDQPARWLWVTKPEYYQSEAGVELPHLRPGSGGGWWTCHPATRCGDLVMLYRARDRKDIAYLLVARSDPEVADEPGWEFNGHHVCDYEVVEKFAAPLSFDTMWDNPELRLSWPALKAKFQGSAHRIPADVWAALGQLLQVDLEKLARQAVDGLHRVELEREIQHLLVDRLDLWTAAGWPGLRLLGKEHRFVDGTKADLVFDQSRRWRDRRVVVELKRGRITIDAVRQVLGYRAHLDRESSLWSASPVAVLVGNGIDDEARAEALTHGVGFIDIGDLRVVVEKTRVTVLD